MRDGQYYLHPDDKHKKNGGCIVHSVIPTKTRQFNKMIDLKLLKVGDLILISRIKYSVFDIWAWVSHYMISSTQKRGGYADYDSRWTHAAVYVLDDRICEATAKGVSSSLIWNYFDGKHLIRVRRNNNLTIDEKYKLAIFATSNQGMKYGWRNVVELFIRSLQGGFNKPAGNGAVMNRTLFCSQLYTSSHWLATKCDVGNPVMEDFTPASLSACKVLEDVDIEWTLITSTE